MSATRRCCGSGLVTLRSIADPEVIYGACAYCGKPVKAVRQWRWEVEEHESAVET